MNEYDSQIPANDNTKHKIAYFCNKKKQNERDLSTFAAEFYDGSI